MASVVICMSLLCCSPGESAKQAPEFIAATNRGKAYLENAEPSLAIEAFEQALDLAPESPLALRNLARAYLLARNAGALEVTLARARDVLAAVTTHRVPLSEIARAFELASDKSAGSVKVTVQP